MMAPTLQAYRIDLKEMFANPRPGAGYHKIVPAAADRFWMDFTTKGWANRCLPLRIANQCGWFILNDADFEVTWNGKPGLDDLKITGRDGRRPQYVQSMFGFGIVTWVIPYLFRTSAGFNLLARGPANSVKDGVAPLEGLVETDWLPYPFTMNWKVTRPFQKIKFDKDEPICMLVPSQRGEVESFEPEVRNLNSVPELHASYSAWHHERRERVKAAKGAPMERAKKLMQGNYIRGEGELGERATEHQNQLHVRPFSDTEPAPDVGQPLPPVEKDKGLIGKLFGR